MVQFHTEGVLLEGDHSRTAACRCGKVKLGALGAPIATTACFCDSCRTAGRAFETLPGAAPVLNADGGVAYVIFRKDRLEGLRGCDLLAERRETPDSPTRRVVATCCNSFMFLDFQRGHWVNLARDRLPPSERPPVEAYVMTGDLADPPAAVCGVTRSKSLTPRLMAKLFAAWAAMGFGRGKIDFVERTLDA